jgi:flagellar basal body-associated protein FliL
MRKMTKKKWIIIGVVVLAVITSLAIAIPVFAANANATPSPTQLTQTTKAGALLRLLLVQDQTTAFNYVSQAEAAGKITATKPPQSIISGLSIMRSLPRPLC